MTQERPGKSYDEWSMEFLLAEVAAKLKPEYEQREAEQRRLLDQTECRSTIPHQQ